MIFRVDIPDDSDELKSLIDAHQESQLQVENERLTREEYVTNIVLGFARQRNRDTYVHKAMTEDLTLLKESLGDAQDIRNKRRSRV